jgi:hypothetical protein
MRQPAAADYDASVGLEPKQPGEIPTFAYGLVKRSYQIQAGRLVAAAPEPLRFDLYDDPSLDPRMPPGSDFWVWKTATDVVVQGSAHAPKGKPTASMMVAIATGDLETRVAVFGRRLIEWRGDGAPRIPAPETFTEMPLTYANAYGGVDPRVPIPEDMRDEYMQLASMGVAPDHPGLYPRNAIGKGYLVYPDPIAGLELPNLEDPKDLLTLERLVTGAPELWHRQPLPWCFEWTNALMYPRELYLGLDAWFPCPQPGALPEVRRGFVPAAVAAPLGTRIIPPTEYFQEASLGMVARRPLAGLPLTVTGMHPEETSLTFLVPVEPSIEIEVAGQRSTPRPWLTSLVIRPAEKMVHAVWCARTTELPRKFIPGVHKNIPLAMSVNRGSSIKYQSPPAVRDRLMAAGMAPPTSEV